MGWHNTDRQPNIRRLAEALAADPPAEGIGGGFLRRVITHASHQPSNRWVNTKYVFLFVS